MNAPCARVLTGFVSVLSLASCTVDLTPGDPVGIQVELYFTQPHADVSATWEGELVSTQYSDAAFPNADRRASSSLPENVDVEGPLLVRLPAQTGLMPGRWDITITIHEGSIRLPMVRCNRASIGDPGLSTGTVYTVRWVEGGSGGCTTAIGLDDPAVERDAQAVSLTVPASAVLGISVPVAVSVRNNGEITETIDVDLRALPPGGLPITSVANQDPTVASNGSTQVAFNWNTSCAGPAGSYTLTAVATVPDDGDTSNNTTPPQSITMTADREVQIGNPFGPAIASRAIAGGVQYGVTITNGNSQSEGNLNVTLADTSAVEGAGAFQWLGASTPPVNLACGEARQLSFVYFPPSVGPGGAHTLTVTVNPGTPIPGDDPVNNTLTIPITVGP
jgi:hypothetical protein